jgi:hypothetical protein
VSDIPDIGKMVSDTPRTDKNRFHSDIGGWVCYSSLCRQLEQELNAANDRIKRMEECTQIAWGIIANVDSGSWGEQRADWREAAIRWRDEQFHPAFRLSEHQAKEAKL